MMEATKDAADLRRQLHDARNEIRRLKGEPEVSEEEGAAAQRESLRRWIEQVTGKVSE
jgi:hypothetical protein